MRHAMPTSVHARHQCSRWHARLKIGALSCRSPRFGCRQKQARKERKPMEKYIGLDVHAASTTFAVIGQSGRRLGTYVVETNGQALVAQLKAVSGNKHVCLEEGTQSAWLYEILSPWVAQVVVVAV